MPDGGGLCGNSFAVVGYGICSSLMLVVNKLAVHYLPAPSFVLLTQFFASWFVVKAFGQCGAIEVDALEKRKLRAFLPISAAFLACVYANMKTLQFANVRSCAAPGPTPARSASRSLPRLDGAQRGRPSIRPHQPIPRDLAEPTLGAGDCPPACQP
jgi:hypothetical protein